MLMFKSLINYLISKTSGNLFCLLRTFFEKILYGSKRTLYFKKSQYIRKFDKLKKTIYFPDKERSRLYSKGYNYRLDTLSKMYLLDTINFDDGDIVIDCGANIGEIKFVLDNLNKKIDYHGFEPGSKEFECLKKNLQEGKLYNYGLWHKNSYLNFYEKTDTADSSFIINGRFDNTSKKKVARLDNFNFKKIKLLKVEAEGAEPEVLLGTAKILERIEFISVDCGPERGLKLEKTDEEVIKFLKNYKFDLIERSKMRDVCLFKNTN